MNVAESYFSHNSILTVISFSGINRNSIHNLIHNSNCSKLAASEFNFVDFVHFSSSFGWKLLAFWLACIVSSCSEVVKRYFQFFLKLLMCQLERVQIHIAQYRLHILEIAQITSLPFVQLHTMFQFFLWRMQHNHQIGEIWISLIFIPLFVSPLVKIAHTKLITQIPFHRDSTL